MKNIPHHHRLYAAIFAMLGAFAVYFFIQAERATIALQNQTAQTIKDTPDKLITAVHTEGDRTRTLVSDQLTGMRTDVKTLVTDRTDAAMKRFDATLKVASKTESDANDQLTAIRADVKGIVTTADNRLAAVQKNLNDQLTLITGQTAAVSAPFAAALQQLPGQVDVLNGNLALVLKPAGAAASQVNEALPDFLDCYNNGFGNPDCIQARYAELTGSFRRIADSIDKWIARLTAPPTVKQEISNWLHLLVIAASHGFTF